jgi:hypothetical protein
MRVSRTERALWAAYVKKREAEQRPKRPRAKKQRDRMTPAEMKAELDDLVSEAEQRSRVAAHGFSPDPD